MCEDMSNVSRPKFMADFETVVADETRVWLWGLVNLKTGTFQYGSDIDSFMDTITRMDCIIYFHNLKFDIQFIYYWLFKNGYKHSSARRINPGYFSTLISDMGVFYSTNLCSYKGTKVQFLDSLKIIPLPVRAIPKAFGIEEEKLLIDYEAVRDIHHVPTQDEIDYVRNDCVIVAKALNIMMSQGMNRMTAGSNALSFYKNSLDKGEFETLFPKLSLMTDNDCRRAYRGGWTYVNPRYADKRVGAGRVYDVHSMYPWVMHEKLLPFGEPIYYEGQYTYDSLYPLYIQCMSCTFKLKPNHYPSIQLKGSTRFVETEYIEDSGEIPQLLYLTSVDLELLKENYELDNVEYISGYKFRGRTGLFRDYIDYWYKVKSDSDKTGNKGMRQIAKLMLNSLYGKFGTNPRKRSKYPYLRDDIVRYEYGEEEITDGLYVPLASFITSYARDRIIRSANLCGDRFVYADTDSLHIIGDEEPNIDIHDSKLGYFGLESRFKSALFHRPKCYIEEVIEEDGTKLNRKCAGMPESVKKELNFETLKKGSVFGGKLRPVNVKGGQVLVPTTFTIK